jgi:hypothetical protein
MHTNQTSNFLTADNPPFPFPQEVKDLLPKVTWDDVVWNTIGLPAFQCTFSLSGSQLYFEKDENEQVKLKKETFTGQALARAVIRIKDHHEVFFLTFELSFCGGVLTDAELKEFKKESLEVYEAGFLKFKTAMEKEGRIRKSWWFRYLYTPYYYIFGGLTMLVISFVQLCCDGVIWVVNKMLPYKL